jgi:hypothetical protein
MTNRKFHKRVVTLEILSEEPIPEGMDIANIIFEAQEGDYSMRECDEKDTILDGKQAAKALLQQNSDPSFFQLTPNGDDL